MVKADPRNGIYLACALVVRGQDIQISDLRRNIDRIHRTLRFTAWNKHAWKTGICSVPPPNQNCSVLCLSNNTVVKDMFTDIRSRFMRLYKRKANLHHYTSVIDESEFKSALRSVDQIIAEYTSVRE